MGVSPVSIDRMAFLYVGCFEFLRTVLGARAVPEERNLSSEIGIVRLRIRPHTFATYRLYLPIRDFWEVSSLLARFVCGDVREIQTKRMF